MSSRSAPFTLLAIASVTTIAILTLIFERQTQEHIYGQVSGTEGSNAVPNTLVPLPQKLEAALVKKLAELEKGVTIIQNKLDTALEVLSDSSVQADNSVQKTQTVHTIQSPTKPTFKVATYAADVDIYGWITYDDVHWRLIRRYFLEHQQAEPHHYKRAGTMLVVDAGCNHGTYSLFAAAHGYRVLCLEINPELSKLVEQSKALNPALGYLISTQTLGVGAARQTRPFNPDGGGTYLRPIAPTGAGEMQAHIRLLDDFVFEPWQLLKIDVEGFEIPALQGSKLAIQSYGVGAILVEIGPARWDRAGVTLEDGFQVLAWVISAGMYDAYVLLRDGGTCPDDAIQNLTVRTNGRGKLQVQRPDDLGTESLGDRVLWLGEPLGDSLLPLLQEMSRNGWDCNFWLEKRAPMN